MKNYKKIGWFLFLFNSIMLCGCGDKSNNSQVSANINSNDAIVNSWNTYIAEVKSRIPQAIQSWKDLGEDHNLIIKFGKDDVTTTKSLKYDAEGKANLEVTRVTGEIKIENTYDFQFGYKNGKWHYINSKDKYGDFDFRKWRFFQILFNIGEQ
jgi:hypothetical protein